MALTKFREYKWLIELLEKETNEQNCMTLEEINQRYRWEKEEIYKKADDSKSGYIHSGLPERKVKLKDENGNVILDENGKPKVTYEDPVINSKTFLNWRHAIYRQFGLLIQQPVEKEKIGQIIHEFVKNKYYLANPELLDNSSTLRKTIERLANDEGRGYEEKSPLTVSPRGRKKKVEGVSERTLSMGFFSTGVNDMDYASTNPQFGYREEPEMVDIIRFLMTIGEALVIKNRGKNCVFEPQDLKCINDRWYVAGNIYEYKGDAEDTRLVIFDIDTIKICEDEDLETPLYKLVEGFDLTHLIPWDWNKHFNQENIVSLYLDVRGTIFESQPFCPTQMKVMDKGKGLIRRNIYRIYVKPDRNFILQYLATGDNVIVCNPHNEIPRTPTDITDEQIEYLRKLKRKG